MCVVENAEGDEAQNASAISSGRSREISEGHS
jgi:hypothetical protein